MRRALFLLTIFSAVVTYGLWRTSPVGATSQDCWQYKVTVHNIDDHTLEVYLKVFEGSKSTSKTFSIDSGETETHSVHRFFATGASVTGSSSTQGNAIFDATGLMIVSESVCESNGPDGGNFATIGDGRINDGTDELGAPLAAYCLGDGSVSVWDVSIDGKGALGFTATGAEINSALAAAKSSGQNQLIGAGLGNSLYALKSGELEMMGPEVNEPSKTYTFVAPGDRCVPSPA